MNDEQVGEKTRTSYNNHKQVNRPMMMKLFGQNIHHPSIKPLESSKMSMLKTQLDR